MFRVVLFDQMGMCMAFYVDGLSDILQICFYALCVSLNSWEKKGFARNAVCLKFSLRGLRFESRRQFGWGLLCQVFAGGRAVESCHMSPGHYTNGRCYNQVPLRPEVSPASQAQIWR
jgi:hypothetical protein